MLIDCQSHLFSPGIIALLEGRREDPRVFEENGERVLQMGGWRRKIPPSYLDVNAKLAAMDAAGVDLAALSINDPGPEWFGEQAPEVARLANDFIAETVAQHSTRFFGLGVLPWNDEPSSLAELERCAAMPAMKGVLLYTNLAGRFPDEAPFRPILTRAVELGLPLLLHPAKPVTTEQVKDYEMTSTLGNMFENTIALTRLILSGILDDLPEMKLVCPHLGGALPYVAGRLDHQVTVLKRGPRHLRHKPSDYLKRVWMDVVSPSPLAMKYALEMVGPERLLFASDHPWVEPKLILDTLRVLELPGEIERKILAENARRLFGLAV